MKLKISRSLKGRLLELPDTGKPSFASDKADLYCDKETGFCLLKLKSVGSKTFLEGLGESVTKLLFIVSLSETTLAVMGLPEKDQSGVFMVEDGSRIRLL